MSNSSPKTGDGRVNILGVEITPMTLAETVLELSSWIENNQPGYINFCSVNDIIECYKNREIKSAVNKGLAVTDGMPLVWLSWFHGFRKATRVYGPDLLPALCKEAADKGYRQFFYGGAPGVAQKLSMVLKNRFPGLIVAGTYTPKHLAVGEMEDAQVVEQINAANPDVIWLGLGAPKQNVWMAKHRHLLNAPVLAGVGAAFDFHTGKLSQAPGWMQRNGLEWFYRLLQEPRRLAFRYLIYNPLFILLILLQLTGVRKFQP